MSISTKTEAFLRVYSKMEHKIKKSSPFHQAHVRRKNIPGHSSKSYDLCFITQATVGGSPPVTCQHLCSHRPFLKHFYQLSSVTGLRQRAETMRTVIFAREVMITSSKQAKECKLRNACATISELEQSLGEGESSTGHLTSLSADVQTQSICS